MLTMRDMIAKMQNIAAAQIDEGQKVVAQNLLVALGIVSLADAKGITAKHALESAIADICAGKQVGLFTEILNTPEAGSERD